jgi:hypothetical protein
VPLPFGRTPHHGFGHRPPPASAGGRLPVQITVGGARSKLSPKIMIVCDAPVVLSCTPSGNPGDGMSIRDRNFGTTQHQSCQVRIGKYLSDAVKVFVSHSQIDCRIFDALGRDRRNLLMQVSVLGQWSVATPAALFLYKGKEFKVRVEASYQGRCLAS